jgi:dCTP deaminase
LILPDREIAIALERGLISIDPRPKEICFSSTSVDLTLDSTLAQFKSKSKGIDVSLDPGDAEFKTEDALVSLTESITIPPEGFLLPPNKLILGWTKEFIVLKIETRLAARVEGKSSLARFGLGVHVTAPTIHAGFSGCIRLEIINHGALPIRLREDMRICQLIFETTLGTPVRGYGGQFQGQTAPPAPKPKISD